MPYKPPASQPGSCWCGALLQGIPRLYSQEALVHAGCLLPGRRPVSGSACGASTVSAPCPGADHSLGATQSAPKAVCSIMLTCEGCFYSMALLCNNACPKSVPVEYVALCC